MVRLARSWRPRPSVGTDREQARGGAPVGARSVVVNGDDAAAVPFFRWLAYPLASVIVTPDCLRHEGHARQRTHPGCQQLFTRTRRRSAPTRGGVGLGLGAGERAAGWCASRPARPTTTGCADSARRRAASADCLRGVRLFVSAEAALPGLAGAAALSRGGRSSPPRAGARFLLYGRQPEHGGRGRRAGRAVVSGRTTSWGTVILRMRELEGRAGRSFVPGQE